jgi:hypothetical protein
MRHALEREGSLTSCGERASGAQRRIYQAMPCVVGVPTPARKSVGAVFREAGDGGSGS